MTSPETPILLIVFNRPDKARALMSALEKVRPTKLYVSADGPRPHVPKDQTLCAETRDIMQKPSWPCEVITRFSDVNLGVDPAVESAISWFFTQVESGVILEDDCIPHPDFFRFVSIMLDRYHMDERVMMISGDNFQDGVKRGDGDYYFSRYPNAWGWASWRRSWAHYDTSLSALPAFCREQKIKSIRPDRKEQKYWLRYFKKLYRGKYTPWDAKWVFAIWNVNGVAVIPNENLVENIGFGEDSTHTKEEGDSRIKTAALGPELKEPSNRDTNEEADSYLFRRIFYVTIGRRILNLIIRTIRT